MIDHDKDCSDWAFVIPLGLTVLLVTSGIV